MKNGRGPRGIKRNKDEGMTLRLIVIVSNWYGHSGSGRSDWKLFTTNHKRSFNGQTHQQIDKNEQCIPTESTDHTCILFKVNKPEDFAAIWSTALWVYNW